MVNELFLLKMSKMGSHA